MEMSFIKLCEPKLDESSDSVLERIVELENAVKNRSFAPANAPVTQAPQKPVQKADESTLTDTEKFSPLSMLIKRLKQIHQ